MAYARSAVRQPVVVYRRSYHQAIQLGNALRRYTEEIWQSPVIQHKNW